MQSKPLLWMIVVLMITTIIIGVFSCEHKNETITPITNKTIETKRTEEEPNKEGKEDEKTIETETNKDGDANQAVEPVSLGKFKLTAYCSCKKCCGKWAYNRPTDENGNQIVYGATGEILKEDYSIAVDPTVIAYQTEVIINGHTYKAQDCGGKIKGNRIDVYFENHQDALEFGVQYVEVFVKVD